MDLKRQLQQEYEEEQAREKSTKYQMIYQYKDEEYVVNRIVEFDDLEFDEEFYHFNNDKGYGVVIKMESEGEIYEICADECKCYVECKEDDQCNDGMFCSSEYKCVDNDEQGKRRNGETNHIERKFAQVAITVPLMCIFGVFTSMFLAKEYGDKYYHDTCDDACPETTDHFEFHSSAEQKYDKDIIWFCGGHCVFNPSYWNDRVEGVLEGKYLIGIDDNLNVAKTMCEQADIVDEVVTDTYTKAVTKFHLLLDMHCRSLRHEMIHTFDKGEKAFTHFFEICDLDEKTVNCNPNAPVDFENLPIP